ncbi:MAG TPA: PAS domain-containing sensor histidine kinase [Allocoleopsis sp.]
MEKNTTVLDPFDIINQHTTGFISKDDQGNQESIESIKIKYQNIVENAAIGIYHATEWGSYLLLNSRLAAICGYESAQIMQDNIHQIKDWYVNEHKYMELINLLPEQKYVYGFETQVYRQDGSIIWVRQNLSVIDDQDGNLISYSGTVEDITKQKELETQLKEALKKEQEKNIVKSNFLSMISHDIKSALTVILVAADFLRIHGAKISGETHLKYLGKIINTVKNLTQFIDKFIALGKAEQGHFKTENVNLSDLCQDVWDDLKAINNTEHQLSIISNSDKVNIISDSTLLRQILINLLSNAIKYSPNGSQVEVKIMAKSEKMVLQIKDDGIGISSEDQEHLFGIFERGKNTSKISGSGIGLAIVKKSVELQGGKITVKSKVGKGTTFIIALPMVCNFISHSY